MTRRFREAFVICPLSEKETQVRHRSNDLFDYVIEPVMSGRFSCQVGRADFFFDDPEFMQVIHNHIARADIVIADLTDLNANVFYELGHCHMLGVPCVLFIDDVHRLPSDLKHHKAIPYSREAIADEDRRAVITAEFQAQVGGLRGFTPRDLPQAIRPRMIARLNLTVVEELHNGRRDHYKMARRLVAQCPPKMFLMQRSSSLILGPEAEWGDEAGFYEAVWSAIENGSELMHVVSLEGISRHLQRPQSEFPGVRQALDRLTTVGRSVAVPRRGGSPLPIRAVPEGGIDVDLKPDRQARVLLADFGDISEGILVMDLGGRQVSIRIRGEEANNLFYSCQDFYSACDGLTWDHLYKVLRDAGVRDLDPPTDEN